MAASKKITLNREETERFIQYYMGHECLWNVSSGVYAKRDHRQAAYVSIATLMGNGMTADQVPAKISTLRTYYSKELRREAGSKKSGAAAGDIYVSQWEFFKLLDSFLRPQVHQKSSVTNMDTTGAICIPDEFEAKLPDEAHESAGVLQYQDAVPSTSSSLPETHLPEKRSKKEDIQGHVLQTLKAIEQRRSQKENEGEFLFGRYIANELSMINDFKARQELKLKIQQLIFEYQCGNN